MRSRSRQQHHDPTGTASREIRRKPEAMRIELLGGFRLWVGPRPIEEDRWRLRKARSLGSCSPYLPDIRSTANNRPWSSCGRALIRTQVANNLHQVLHVARRALEPTTPG